MHKKTIIYYIFFSFYFIWGNALFAQTQVNADQKIISFLGKFRSDYCHGILMKEIEVIQGYYAPDIRLMPEFQKTIIGKNNTEVYYKSFFTRFDIKEYTREVGKLLDLKTQVVEIGEFKSTLVLTNTGAAHKIEGKYLTIWKKSENGHLSLITEAWNYNHPLEIEEDLKFAEVPSIVPALQAHVPIDNPLRFELAALNSLMEATVKQHDATVWKQFYKDDGMFLYSRHELCKGRKSLDDFFDNHVKSLPIFENLDIRNDRIDDLGEFVIEYASHIALIRNGDFSGIFTGKDIRIWQRLPSGSLKMFCGMAMYD